ncbi:MAG: cytochrome c [Bacteroidota bacterium]|nr:cytochrome c [Bacteroidota bacterium]
MKKILLFPVFLLLFCVNLTLQAQNSGEETFKSICAACHTINKGRLVGPDLSGVYLIRKDEWLIRFIRSSQQFIKSGDSAAQSIYNEFNKIPMPDNRLTNEQILSVIEYIKERDRVTLVTAVKSKSNDSLAISNLESKVLNDSLEMKYSTENISEGRDLFNGYARFTNGASPCISCHNINDQSIMGGGQLAIDLTGSYLKLGAAGITAILSNPPFPVMKTAMLNHSLTQDEIHEVISLLKSVANPNEPNMTSDSGGLIFFTFGFVCALFLLIHIFIFYDNRKIT